MTHLGLFEGIGGFSLAARWMGWKTLAWCEWNEFGQKVLKHHFPEAEGFGDISKTDFTKYANRIDILTGGFPCQDNSNALQSGGGQQGLAGKRTGLLFEMCRAIKEIRPKYVIAENVTNTLKINGGGDFRTILNELAGMGYNAEWRVCYASEVGAPHRRGRLYVVAYSNSFGIQRNKSFFSLLPKTTDPQRRTITGTNVEINSDNEWLHKSPTYIMDNGLPDKLALADTIKAAGNAIVPQVALQIFKAIQQYENIQKHTK